MKLKKKPFARLLSAALCAALLMSSSAFAASYDSSVSTSTVAGVEYEYWGTLYVDSSTSFRAGAWINRADDQEIPSGTSVKATALLYDVNGDQIESSGAEEHDSGTSFAYATTSRVRSTDPVYAQGQFLVKSGSTSKTLYSYYTRTAGGTRSAADPIMALAAETLGETSSYPVNAQGETYGSGLLASIVGVEPDLISAVTANGTEGYIRAEDSMNAQLAATTEAQTIPLYDLAGAVIGEFVIQPSSTDYIPEVEETIQRLKNRTLLAQTRVAVAGDAGDEHYQMTLEESEAVKAMVEAAAPKTKVNSHGYTYGSSVGKTEETMPDLIACRATNGERGYCWYKDFPFFEPGEKDITVYDCEGEEVLGIYRIRSGN